MDISTILKYITDDKKKNIEYLKRYVNEYLEQIDFDGSTLLHLFCRDIDVLEEPKRFLVIQTLLDYGLGVNDEDVTGQNFIQTAMYSGTTEQFILQLIDEALKYGLDVNHQDCTGNTIIHTAIFSDNYDIDELISIGKLLSNRNFNFNLLNNEGMDLIKSLNVCGNYSNEEINIFKKKLSIAKELAKEMSKTVELEDLEVLEKYGKILNNNVYKTNPAIGRDKELMNIMISLAKSHENPILVGESGVGKSVLCDELAYRIKQNNVPKFLKNKIILETMPSFLVSGCKYVGQFEEKMHTFLKVCHRNQVIVVINEIHNIYGTGASENNDTDMAEILKSYLEKSNIKIIGTTTDMEYQKFFANNALKRRFSKIDIKEPDDETLAIILHKVIQDKLEENNIESRDFKRIIDIIVNLTNKKHRIYNDIENNPALALSILDTAFAYLKVMDDTNIDIKHFICAVETNYRLYESAKEQAINKLKEIELSKPKQLKKIIEINTSF